MQLGYLNTSIFDEPIDAWMMPVDTSGKLTGDLATLGLRAFGNKFINEYDSDLKKGSLAPGKATIYYRGSSKRNVTPNTVIMATVRATSTHYLLSGNVESAIYNTLRLAKIVEAKAVAIPHPKLWPQGVSTIESAWSMLEQAVAEVVEGSRSDGLQFDGWVYLFPDEPELTIEQQQERYLGMVKRCKVKEPAIVEATAPLIITGTTQVKCHVCEQWTPKEGAMAIGYEGTQGWNKFYCPKCWSKSPTTH